MNHIRSLNNRINNLHERALRLVHKDSNLIFLQLLESVNSLPIHQRSVQNITLEIFKVKNDLASEIMTELFASNISNNTSEVKAILDASILELLFGCPTTNFGPLSKGQPD